MDLRGSAIALSRVLDISAAVVRAEVLEWSDADARWLLGSRCGTHSGQHKIDSGNIKGRTKIFPCPTSSGTSERASEQVSAARSGAREQSE